MLSRIAESLFWMGRYIERADGTARLLDVQLQLLLEDPWLEEDQVCRSLLAVIGSDSKFDGPVTKELMLQTISLDRGDSSSIASSILAARENARRVREVISTELWEGINTTKGRLPRKVAIEKSHDFFAWVRERTAIVVGVVEGSMTRDEAWNFFMLGRALERIDMTARLLATSELTENIGPSWTTILRSCGAYESYLRTYRGVPSATNAAEFLLLDRNFPRSVLFALNSSELALGELNPDAGRTSSADLVQRQIGLLRTQLEFRASSEILENLRAEMVRLQQKVAEVSAGISSRYFPANAIPTWIGEVS
jgi:uncharacterized alpha-E superfamily protein